MTSMSDVFKVSEQVKGHPINGFVAPGYEPVLEVFKENFLCLLYTSPSPRD